MNYYFVNGEIIAKKEPSYTIKGIHFTDHQSLFESEVSTADLLKWYNSNVENKIKKFETRQLGVVKVFRLLGHAIPGDDEPVESGQQQAKPTKKVAAPAKTPSDAPVAVKNGQRGRSSRFAGMRLHSAIMRDPETDIIPNPRRKGSWGYKSLQMILDATDGITYEEFMAAGGRSQDLRWDVDHGNVIAE